MSRLTLIASWFCTCLGMTLLLLVPLVVPDSALASTGDDCLKGSGGNQQFAINCCHAMCGDQTCLDDCCAIVCGSTSNQCYLDCTAKACFGNLFCKTTDCYAVGTSQCNQSTNNCSQDTKVGQCAACKCQRNPTGQCICN